MSALSQFLKKSKKPEIYPLLGILGCALGGAAFFGAHALKAPDVVWDHKDNPHPWLEIRDGEQVKLITMNQQYDKRWDRKKW
jgi:NADH dehydrogenase (ubiquinone) 1 alpha subcomplex subunit 4